jgi:NAD(P)H-nitrite reductase large subunit
MDPTPVDRCVCHNVTFADLLRIHRETGADVDELQRRTRCGTSCGMCLPYIRVSLKTGQVRLPVMPFGPGGAPK